jgi:uncharacterized protein with PhoU and TrkA domain
MGTVSGGSPREVVAGHTSVVDPTLERLASLVARDTDLHPTVQHLLADGEALVSGLELTRLVGTIAKREMTIILTERAASVVPSGTGL